MKEITPDHFQYCVEHHIKDCEFPSDTQTRVSIFLGEVQEMVQVIEQDHSRDHVVEEIGDTLFTLFGIMNLHGISFDECANNVLTKNMNRYNGAIKANLRAEGVPENRLYKVAKQRWEDGQ